MNEKAPSSPLGSDLIAHENVDDFEHEDCNDESLNLSIGNSEISLTSLGKDPEDLIIKAERVSRICAEIWLLNLCI
jgi:hypothetical protein